MRAKDIITIIIYSVFFLLFISIIGFNITEQFNNKEYTVTITDKVVKHSKESSKYLVFTELKNGGIRVFKDTDSILRWKFNSSDIYGELKKGHIYKLDVYGYRNTFFSSYENIVSLKEIK